MGDYISLMIGAILVNNFVLSRILGICPFLGVSRNIGTAAGMSGAVIFVMTLSGLLTATLNILILQPLQLEYLRTIVFILAIDGLVQIVEVILQRISQPYTRRWVFICFDHHQLRCFGFGVICADKDMTSCAAQYSVCLGGRFRTCLLLFSSLREKTRVGQSAECFQGRQLP